MNTRRAKFNYSTFLVSHVHVTLFIWGKIEAILHGGSASISPCLSDNIRYYLTIYQSIFYHG